ncbi:MAG TPA: rod shape-determining protein MreD [Acetobacteraceae bacterium]
MVEIGPTPAIRSRPTLGGRLDAIARACVPVALTLVLVLAAGAPLGLPGQAALRPALALICVFHYSLARPAAMPALAVFAIGLLSDLLGWLPIGIGAVTLLGARVAALRLRPVLAGHGIGLVWIAFVGTAIAVGTATWVLASLLSWRVLPTGPVLLATLFAVALHPSLALLFGRTGRGIAAPEGA